MSVLDIINVGCAILSTCAEVAPFIKKYISNKASKKMEARRTSRQATVESDDEDEEYTLPRRRSEPSSEESIDSGELKDIMETLQAQSEVVQAHSQMLSRLVQERSLGDSDRLSNIPEDSNIQVLSYLDNEFRRKSFQTSLQDFAFPPLDHAPQSELSSPMSRTSSYSMSNASIPSSPTTSISSASSFSLPVEHRGLSAYSPRNLAFPTPNPNLPSSPTASFPGSSSFTSSLNRRVSFRPSPARMPSTAVKSSSVDMTPEKALSAPLPNKYQGSRRSHSRTISLPIPEHPQRSQRELLEGPSDQALSYPPLNRYPPRSYEPTSSSLPSSSTSARMGLRSRTSTFTSQTQEIPQLPLQDSVRHRSSSFSSQTKHRHTSLQSLQPPHRRPSDIPPKEQWRRSLKSSNSPTSSASHSPTLSNASTNPSTHSATTPTPSSPRTSISISTPTTKPITKPDSFQNILPLSTLKQLPKYFPTIHPSQMTHYASIWSYAETLHQLLHPDHISPSSSSTVTRTYISSPVRSYIFNLAFSIPEGEEIEGNGFVLLLFLLRFVMLFGVESLNGAPEQMGDPTGLREVESRYKIVGEILEVIEKESEGGL